MNTLIVNGLLWFSALGAGLIAGVFFAFSTFIMTALGRSGPGPGIRAMNSINTTILKSLFMPVFYGTTLTSVALGAVAIVRWDGSLPTAATLAAAILYVAGMFLCTIVFNVPLNNALAAVDPDSSNGAAIWARYLKDWTFWNHVRTVAALVAAALFAFATCPWA